MKILLVEDDPGIISFLKKGLDAVGYAVVVAKDGESGSNLATREEFDIAIIDILLPGKDGHTVLRELREAKKDYPVIMLSVRSDTETKVRALNAGAVDYLTKPFDFEELLARLQVHLSHSFSGSRNLLQVGTVSLDINRRVLCCRGVQMQLTSREFSLLEYFLRREGQVLSRMQIINHVWEYNFDPSSNVVDVYIRHLRQKLVQLGSDVTIETVRGTGYRLDCKTGGSSEKPAGEI